MAQSAEDNPSYSDTYFDKHEMAARNSARQVVPFVMSVLRPTSIADVGCGSGQWTKEFISNGVRKAYAFDAFASPCWGVTANSVEFQKIDLENRVADFPDVELVCWLEVAEHLSESSCSRILSDIVERTDAILFSCALPGQGGTGHISERRLSDWVSDFEEVGFCCEDILRPRFWNDEDISWWYRQNTVIFVKENSVASNAILKFQLPTFRGMDLIHPDLFEVNRTYSKDIKD